MIPEVTAEVAGRSYVSKVYRIALSRQPVVDLLRHGVEASGGRVVSCSFPDHRVAPVFLGAEDGDGHRYGLLTYPFTTTKRPTLNRPPTEHRFQIRYGDPVRMRNEPNPLSHDPAGVDVTLVLAVDPENEIMVGLDPLVYAELPVGISGYYRQSNAAAVRDAGWSVWAREKARPRTPQGESWEGLESMVGFRPKRLLDYARFEALATSLGLDTALRLDLADSFTLRRPKRHELEELFSLDASTILDIVESNFRLGVAVRGGVAEYHLGRSLRAQMLVDQVEPIDLDGEPDFHVVLQDGRELTIECKNALRETYKDGDAKVEVQKTRDSGAGRKYRFDAFDIVAACMFSVTGRWHFKFKWTRQLTPWSKDRERIAAIQRIDDTWADSLDNLIETSAPT